MRPSLFPVTFAFSLVSVAVVLLSIALGMAPTRQAHAITYDVSMSAEYCNGLSGSFPATVPATEPSLAGNPACTDGIIATNTSYDLTVRTLATSSLAGQSQHGSMIHTFISNDHFTAADADIPNGQIVGALTREVTLSLLNGACTTALTTEVILYDSATSGPTASPASEGTANRFSGLVTDGGDAYENIADATSSFVMNNLTIYENLLDPDLDYPGGPNGPLPPVTPKARYSGAVKMPAGPAGEWQIISVLQFGAAQLFLLDDFAADPDNKPHSLGRASYDPGGSDVMLTVTNDPNQAQFAVSPITDQCNPQRDTLMLLGTTPGGQTRFKTPLNHDSYMIGQWSYSQRDLDGDDFENVLDSCPYTINLNSDSDGDGIDNVCDLPGGGADVDGDGFQNRQDNCNLVGNGGANQRDDEMRQSYKKVAPSGGPKGDFIGDSCEVGSETGVQCFDGIDNNGNTMIDEGCMADGDWEEIYNEVPKCIGPGPDLDMDGYCASEDPDDSALTGAAFAGWTDNDGPDVEFQNPHGDGWGAHAELYIGTDPLSRCAATPIANDEPIDAVPADFNDNQMITISDVLALKPVFNMSVPAVSPRFDLVPNGVITISDVLSIKPVFNLTCPP